MSGPQWEMVFNSFLLYRAMKVDLSLYTSTPYKYLDLVAIKWNCVKHSSCINILGILQKQFTVLSLSLQFWWRVNNFIYFLNVSTVLYWYMCYLHSICTYNKLCSVYSFDFMFVIYLLLKSDYTVLYKNHIIFFKPLDQQLCYW